MKRIYIAGPMTGIVGYNYPAFNSAAKDLREAGYDVLNPAENPPPACGTWQGYMRRSIAQLVECEQIALLPGWQNSKGASIEYKLGQDIGIGAATVGYLLLAADHKPPAPAPEHPAPGAGHAKQS